MSQVFTASESMRDQKVDSAKTESNARSGKSRSEARTFTLSKTQILMLLGTALFVVSHFFTWWELKLVAPQFPGGLFIQATSYEIQDSPKTPFNDIREVDGLNHYIGMMSLGDAAQIEMMLAIPAIILFTALAIAAVFLIKRTKWASLLIAPVILFPFAYLADLAYWLWYAGHNLDPMAAITLPPFTPRVLGVGEIMQFSTEAYFQVGWYIAAAGSVVLLVALVMSLRRKPEEI